MQRLKLLCIKIASCTKIELCTEIDLLQCDYQSSHLDIGSLKDITRSMTIWITVFSDALAASGSPIAISRDTWTQPITFKDMQDDQRSTRQARQSATHHRVA